VQAAGAIEIADVSGFRDAIGRPLGTAAPGIGLTDQRGASIGRRIQLVSGLARAVGPAGFLQRNWYAMGHLARDAAETPARDVAALVGIAHHALDQPSGFFRDALMKPLVRLQVLAGHDALRSALDAPAAKPVARMRRSRLRDRHA